MPEVLAVVVTFNSNDELRECLRSLGRAAAGSTDVQVVVVDTGQSAETVPVVRAFPGVHYLTVPNRGYGFALNIGMRWADSPFVLCSNADVVYAADAIATMRQALVAHGAAVAGPRTYNGDGSIQPSKHGRPTPWSVVFSTRKVARGRRELMPDRLRRQYYAEHLDDDSIGEVDWLNGHSLLFRRDALEAIGGWDERFFLYYEDVDVCLRLAQRGERCLYVGPAVVRHVQGASTERAGIGWRRHYRHSKVFGTRRHVGAIWAAVLVVMLAMQAAFPRALHRLHRLLARIYQRSVRSTAT